MSTASPSFPPLPSNSAPLHPPVSSGVDVAALAREVCALKRKFERFEKRVRIYEDVDDTNVRLSDARFAAKDLPYFFIQYEMEKDTEGSDFRVMCTTTVKLPESQFALLGSPASVRQLQSWYRTISRCETPCLGSSYLQMNALSNYTSNSFRMFWAYFELSNSMCRVESFNERRVKFLQHSTQKMQSPQGVDQLITQALDQETRQKKLNAVYEGYEAFNTMFSLSSVPVLPSGVRLYEGQGRNENDCMKLTKMVVDGKLTPGMMLERYRPTSTSWHPNVALDFAKPHQGQNGLVCVYEIVPFAQVHAIPVEMFQKTQQCEMEIILQPLLFLEFVSLEVNQKFDARCLMRVAQLTNDQGCFNVMHFRVHTKLPEHKQYEKVEGLNAWKSTQ